MMDIVEEGSVDDVGKFSDADVAPVSSEDERGGASAPVVGFSELMWPQ